MLHFITRVTRHFILFSVLSIAVVLSAIRIGLFCASLYKIEVEAKLTELLNSPVKIGSLQAHFRRGLKPELILKELRLSSNNAGSKPNIELREIRLGINLWAMFTQRQIVPATWITLVGAKLSVVHKADGSFAILGLQGGNEQPIWLLEGRHYELLQSEITWLDQKNHRPAHTFKQVDVSIKNDFSHQRHRINFLSQLPETYGDTLRISAEFSGDFFAPNSLKAKLFIAGKNLHFSKLFAEKLPSQLAIKSGSSDFEIWADWQNAQFTALSGFINSKNLTLQASNQKKLPLKTFKLGFDWQNLPNSWVLAVPELIIALPNKTFQPAHFYLGSHDKAAQQFGATIKSLDLDALQNLASFFMPLFEKDLPNFKKLESLAVKGQFSNTQIFADLKQQHYTINGQFKHFSLLTPAPYPQLQNISGSIAGTQQHGVLTLDSHNANFIAQPMFRSPLALTELAGKLYWQQTEKAWHLSATDLTLDTPYAQSKNTLQVAIPKDTQPTFMDLRSTFVNLNDVSKAKTYFPVTLMSAGLLHYLDEAFIKGQVKQGEFLLYGYLKDFPFKKHEGVFQVLFDAQDVTMKYAQGWPFFEHLNARILFENNGLEVNIKQAKAERATIQAAKISIPSFSESDYVLVENGQYSAEINDGLNYLRHTPLKLPLQAVSEQLTVSGNTQGGLALKIPLTDKVSAKVSGDAKVVNAKLNVLAVDLPISNLSGVFRFTEEGFYSDTLTAFGLGYPLQTKVSLKSDGTLITVTGKTDIKNLSRAFDFPAQEIIQGASDYTVQLNLPFAEKINSSLIIQSDLEGINLVLPDSLAKTTTQKKDFSMQFDLIAGGLLPISMSYDQQLKANVWFDKADKKISSGSLLIGKGDADAPQADTFKIKFNQARFSAPIWLGVLDKLQMSSDKAQLVTQLEIHTPQLLWADQQLGAFDLKLQRNADDWKGTLDCVAAKGRLQIPKNSESNRKIKLDMDQIDLTHLVRLNLPKLTLTDAVAKKLPLFEINSEKLLLRGINLGKLTIDSERAAQGIKFNRFSVTSKEQSLSLTGDWKVQNNQQITQINGQLNAEHFGELLTALKLNDDLEETDAQINFALNWIGAPYQFSLSALSGTMDIKAEGGRISSVEPGFGRLLGVLAMEQWLKRLQLDFGDIYKKGLSVNEINGHFVLKNGKATTDNLIVDAIPAIIKLKGEINLPQQTLDQQISVLPKSSDAVPIAGTIVGGIATVVAQTLTGEYEEGYYLRSKYAVKGKWNNLNVMPLHEQDGLFKKLGRGLTDFSWITQPEQDKKQ